MSTPNKKTFRVSALMGTVATLCFLTGHPAWAAPDMGAHHGQSMGHSGHGMGHGNQMQGYGPHNAADHFLKMGSHLKLSAEQNKQLTTLRDSYIEKNALAEEQLNAAQSDIGKTLFGDEVDLTAANALLDKIGKLESQLWRAFAQQLHDIKALLTPEQKKALNAMRKSHHGATSDTTDAMPMHHGDHAANAEK
ncbi:MAG: hypothetical protein FD130_1073 [Halothiobacillaceae bacterium]|nr:MAG: hypothetical protein FD130_1073 [Halothiobacillaceae bacterium]